jgi:hypothetical protein
MLVVWHLEVLLLAVMVVTEQHLHYQEHLLHMLAVEVEVLLMHLREQGVLVVVVMVVDPALLEQVEQQILVRVVEVQGILLHQQVQVVPESSS